jgi:hypothetical protein
MGQYHQPVNLTKKEFINPHRIGNGLKLIEQVGWEGATSNALFLLLACSNGRGGGDAAPHPMVGRWAGDEIAVIGDYAEADDLKTHNADNIYHTLGEDDASLPEHLQYTDISREVWEMMVECLDLIEHVKEAIK